MESFSNCDTYINQKREIESCEKIFEIKQVHFFEYDGTVEGMLLQKTCNFVLL